MKTLEKVSDFVGKVHGRHRYCGGCGCPVLPRPVQRGKDGVGQ